MWPDNPDDTARLFYLLILLMGLLGFFAIGGRGRGRSGLRCSRR